MPARNQTHPASVEAAAADWIARRDAGLSAAELENFQRWVDDPRHARALARHDRAWAILDRPRQGGKSGAMVVELGARARRRRRRRAGAALAGFAVLFVAIGVWQAGAPGDSTEAGADAASAVVVLPEKRTLPDKSIVELKAGAVIEVDFGGAFRRVALRKGEAHFQVMSDRQRPFVVTADGIEVRAVGTAFSVQLESRQVDVLVTEGQVAVEQPAPTDPAPATAALSRLRESLIVVAGHRVVVDTGASRQASAPAVVPILSAESARRLAWRAARLEFTGTRLAAAVALMNRHGRVQFVIDPHDPAVAKMEVSGFVRADDTDAFLHLLESSLGLQVRRSGDTIAIRTTDH